MIIRARATRPRRSRAAAVPLALVLVPSLLFSQQRSASPDTARRDSSRVQRLERVMISALRGSGAAVISQKTLTSQDLAPRYFGQDVPLLLQGAAPSLTSYAETGNYWGYSYIRLRGIDQSRINLTLDGIPLNDPEDQVLYFADFPDLANSLGSVQVQRGVGTSSNGTAAYAGSINMESLPIFGGQRSADFQLEGGSFGSKRGSAEYRSGLTPDRLAIYARVSDLKTDGYRYHSGVEGKSAFLSAGYFGDRDIVKLTATTGTMRDTMAYLAVPVTDLDTNRRINPLTPQERDGFSERIAALSYTRLFGASTSLATTVYRISTSGDYDVQLAPLTQFNLDFVWYGVTSDWSLRRNGLSVDVGVNANDYSRDHFAFQHPDLEHPIYFNTGHKGDVSGFTKLAYTVGATTWFGDLQARHAEWRYLPDAHADIPTESIAWTFVNPKVGVTRVLNRSTSVYVSYGANTREPARGDMLAGFDNLDTSNVAFVGDLHRVKPESVHDLELGTTFRTRTIDAQANVYSMNFRNEIAPIGQLSYIGNPLRENVASSYRRGIEGDITYRGIAHWLLTANFAASTNRIRDYTDSTGNAPVTYHDVQPLLTPRFMTYERAAFAPSENLWLAVETRYTARSFLQNTDDPLYVLPASLNVDASASWHVKQYEIVGRINNLLDSKKYGSGYAGDGMPDFYVLPPRNFFVTLKLGF
jgi:iron complex outermembrane receptor protein